jgi:hypothetical protein
MEQQRLDLLHSEIMSSEDRLKTLQDEFFNAGSRHRELTIEVERLQASDKSTFQAQKAENALARVRPAVGQYLRLRLASEFFSAPSNPIATSIRDRC